MWELGEDVESSDVHLGFSLNCDYPNSIYRTMRQAIMKLLVKWRAYERHLLE